MTPVQTAPQAPTPAKGATAPRTATQPGAGMAALPGPPTATLLERLGEVAVPITVLAIVSAMIMPLPPFLIDLLISANITLAVIVLTVSMYIVKPVELSIFPTALLLLTLFRLALNISSSRLILLNGNTGTHAAGDVIEAFGNFVVGGNYVIGVVIFLVLIAIQYVVINHGAVRISEVSARFTLDALPGKQMAIDSDLNAGLIDEAEARGRRKALTAEAEFYGAMDGASRFAQRDAVASILITVINILAGFLIGVIQHGMELKRAIETYTVLTIGDGLVTVIPALMISVSGGLIVTRAGTDGQLSVEVRRQVFTNPQPLMLASGVLLLMAAMPGLPKIPFIVLGAGVGYSGWRLRQSAIAAKSPPPQNPGQQPKESVESLLKIELLSLEVGLALVRHVDGGANSLLLRRIAAIRKQLAVDLGFLLPPVRVTDNLSLKATEYVILLKGVEIARFELLANCHLAIHAGPSPKPVEGIAGKEPAFGLPAVWVPSPRSEIARAAGYTVVDAVGILGTHLAEVIRRNASELFTRQDAKRLLDRVAEDHPKAVEDLVPKLMPLATVHKVLQNLLRERVSIRDGQSIVEALGEAGVLTRNPLLLTEFVRQSVRRLIVHPYLTQAGELPAFLLDPAPERLIETSVEHGEQSSHLNLAPQKVREILDSVARAVKPAAGSPVAILASSGARHFLRQIVEGSYPQLAVIAHNEIPPGIRVQSLGVIS